MDKFGIFNLLNSFFTPNKPSDTPTGSNSTTQNDSANSFLNGLLNSFSKPDGDKNQSPQPQNKKIIHPPLQSGMISIMNNHDQFIKRVKERSSTPQKTK